jgi:triosephosphate isomerase
MKKRIVVGNWKMFIESPKDASLFATALRRRARSVSGVNVYLAPSFTLLPTVAQVLNSSPIRVGAQTISAYEDAPHTGDVSAKMLKNVGASFVIVGHSERRVLPRGPGESNDMVREELSRAAEAGLTPILCVGERERENDGEHFSFIETQLSSALKNMPKNMLSKILIAYEPVWAIGKRSEDAMQPQQLQEMVIFIRKTLAELLDRKLALKIPVLYGGSVEPDNAKSLITEGGASGFLVGHASTDLESFLEIIKACK